MSNVIPAKAEIQFKIKQSTGRVMNMYIEFEQEEDGRWIAEAVNMPGAMAYGHTKDDAAAKVQAIVLSNIAQSLTTGEMPPLREHLVFSPSHNDLLAVH